MKKLSLLITFLISISSTFYSQETKEFLSGGIYNENIPEPEEVIGIKIGERPVRYDEVYNYFKKLSELSARVKIFDGLSTHEGRKLFHIIVSSEENISDLKSIKENISIMSYKQKDKRDIAGSITEESPAVAMMNYSIHGDELSGTDASIRLAYQLTAGEDETTKNILNNVITIIYPMENPDGRERYLSMMQQWSSNVPTGDAQAIQHTGVWPWGRTNHYLFDLNRDWFILAHPESRDRISIIREWNPQLVVDAHEMGSYSTYYFNPPREPVHYYIDKKIRKWWDVLAKDQSEAFDQYGWSYYTKESFDDWYPGYGSSYPYFVNGIGILYEQAQTDGTIVKRPAGDTLTFKEAVHHQFISSIANLTTLADNRKDILKDFYLMRKKASEEYVTPDVKAFLINPSKNQSRTDKLIERLLLHGIEIERAKEDFSLDEVKGFYDKEPKEKKFSNGTYIVRTKQPLQLLVNAILEFDPRLSNKNLMEERESLEKGKGTRMYEIGAWNMLMAFNVDAYTSPDLPSVETVTVNKIETIRGDLINPDPQYGYVIDFSDDNVNKALIKLFENDVKVHAVEKEFTIDEREYIPGSLLIRNYENPNLDVNLLKKIAKETGVDIYGVNTALTEKGPNFGSRRYELLHPPKLAILTGPSISSYDFGAIWYLLDYEIRMPYSAINIDYFSRIDLRKYNVLIIPSGNLKKGLGKSGIKKLKEWIEDGGTLISTGSSAVFLADTSEGITKTSLFSQSFKKYDDYIKELGKDEKIGKYKIDSVDFWEGNIKNLKIEKTKDEKLDSEKLKEMDEKGKLFMPRGSIVSVDLDEENWLAFGEGDKVPAIIYTSNAFLAKDPVDVAARFDDKNELRLSGLLWDEAKIRWEKTAYLTRERLGSGQVILFLDEPNFRSYFYGTTRLLLNSILLGPGFGTRQTVEF